MTQILKEYFSLLGLELSSCGDISGTPKILKRVFGSIKDYNVTKYNSKFKVKI